MSRTEFIDENTQAQSEAGGSDRRINVSSRSDGRGYYNSRDKSESYSVVFEDAAVTSGDFVVYLKNDKTDGKHMVVRSASINGAVDSKFSFHLVTGTAGGGATAIPFNLNPADSNRNAAATALATVDSSATPMSGLTSAGEVDHVGVVAGGHEEFRFSDQLRIGQGQAVAIRMDAGTADSKAFGVLYFFFEFGKQ